MADQYTQIAPNSSGVKVDLTELTVGANTVERQRLVVAGGAAAELADVKNADPSASHYGLVVRPLFPVGAIGPGKLEDVALGSGDMGIYVLGGRRDSFGATAGTDGDAHELQLNANGQLRAEMGLVPALVGTNFTRPGDTTAYAAGDQVCNSTSAPTVLTFTSCARVSGGGGTIVDAFFVDESNPSVVGAFELWLFDTTFTPNNDNAAWAGSVTIARTEPIVIPFAVAYKMGTTAVVYKLEDKPRKFKTSGSANLFGAIVARNAYTPANAGRFDVGLWIEQD